MVQNIVSWESEWQHSQKLADSLRQSEKNGSIQRLCFMPGGWACFRSEEPTHTLLRDLSKQCKGNVIAYKWLDGDNCGSSLCQDGTVSWYIPPLKTPRWYSFTEEAIDQTEHCEACTALREKLDFCWETYISMLRELTSSEINEQSSEIAATMLCYGRLRKLSWQTNWIRALTLIDDPLAAVWRIIEKTNSRRGRDKKVGQEQG